MQAGQPFLAVPWEVVSDALIQRRQGSPPGDLQSTSLVKHAALASSCSILPAAYSPAERQLTVVESSVTVHPGLRNEVNLFAGGFPST